MTFFLNVLVILASVLGGVLLIGGFLVESGAPQQAATGVLGIGIAVIPYCLARSAQAMKIANQIGALEARLRELKDAVRESHTVQPNS